MPNAPVDLFGMFCMLRKKEKKVASRIVLGCACQTASSDCIVTKLKASPDFSYHCVRFGFVVCLHKILSLSRVNDPVLKYRLIF